MPLPAPEFRFWNRSVPQSHKRDTGTQCDAQPNHNSYITYLDRRAGTGFGYQYSTDIHVCFREPIASSALEFSNEPIAEKWARRSQCGGSEVYSGILGGICKHSGKTCATAREC